LEKLENDAPGIDKRLIDITKVDAALQHRVANPKVALPISSAQA